MLSIEQQLETGKLVCPVTHQPLIVDGQQLRTPDGRFAYPLVNGVPILLADKDKHEEYLKQQDGAMEQEYAALERRPWFRRFLNRLATLGGDHRSRDSIKHFRELFEGLGPDALCLAIGGGPRSLHPKMVNLNIGLFANVHVVGDAYRLPYADGSVDVTVCNAVLEHLEFPGKATAEMFRVLKPRGQAFAITPFLQQFHAYPDHYQNFTLIGHQRLFERAGFEIVASGPCVGPTFVYCDMLANFVRLLPPRCVTTQLAKVVRLLCVPVKPLDRLLNRNPDVHVMASTTYVLAAKPG